MKVLMTDNKHICKSHMKHVLYILTITNMAVVQNFDVIFAKFNTTGFVLAETVNKCAHKIKVKNADTQQILTILVREANTEC
jgi:hypothetical protein